VVGVSNAIAIVTGDAHACALLIAGLEGIIGLERGSRGVLAYGEITSSGRRKPRP
jgi:hypothetical protein